MRMTAIHQKIATSNLPFTRVPSRFLAQLSGVIATLVVPVITRVSPSARPARPKLVASVTTKEGTCVRVTRTVATRGAVVVVRVRVRVATTIAACAGNQQQPATATEKAVRAHFLRRAL
jgi:hypothetical protein